MEANVAAEVSFLLPEDQVCNFERFFTDLEREQYSLGVETYGLSLTTLEEVCYYSQGPSHIITLSQRTARITQRTNPSRLGCNNELITVKYTTCIILPKPLSDK